jgi:hypothetical protein
LDVLFDEERDPSELGEANRYALMQSGWDRGRLVRGNLLYVVIEAEQVVVEYDGMEQGITDELIAQGVPEAAIVLAWLPQPVEEGPQAMQWLRDEA